MTKEYYGMEPFWEVLDESYEVQMFVPADNLYGGFWRLEGQAAVRFDMAMALLLERRTSKPGVRFRIKRARYEIYHDGGF